MTAHETLVCCPTKETGRIREIPAGSDWRMHRTVRGRLLSRYEAAVGHRCSAYTQPAASHPDEPSSALDPEGRSEVLRLIKELKNMGKTILLSTHNLEDMERVCNTVGMINAGRMVFEKPLAQLQKEYAQPMFDIRPVSPVTSGILDAIELLPGVVSLRKSTKTITVKVVDNTVSVSVMRFLAEHGIVIESFSLRKARLEDLFLQEVNGR